jgi:hypothetical protein
MIREQRDADAYAARHARTVAEEAITLINSAWAPLRQRMVELHVATGGDLGDLDSIRARAAELAAIVEKERTDGLAVLRAYRHRLRTTAVPERMSV